MDVDRINALLKLIQIVGENPSVQNTVREAVKGGILTMTGTVVGALLLGPIGFFFGGVFTGAVVYIAKQNDFVSLPQAINSMSRREREEIAAEMDAFIRNLDIQDIALLTARAAEAIAEGGIEELIKDATLKAIRRNAFAIVSDRWPNMALIN